MESSKNKHYQSSLNILICVHSKYIKSVWKYQTQLFQKKGIVAETIVMIIMDISMAHDP